MEDPSTPRNRSRGAAMSNGERFRFDDRKVESVPPPAWTPLTRDQLFEGADASPNCLNLLEHFKQQGKLDKEHALELIHRAKALFKAEPNVLQNIKPPVYIVGDVHGQFYDVASFFDMCTPPWYGGQWLFLGDYVDRGFFSCEVIFMLFAMKIAFPDKVWLLRGNHECRLLTGHFSFKKECIAKYSLEMWEEFMLAFDCLPLAAVVENMEGRYLCVHAGLSPDINSIDEIDDLDRFHEIPKRGPLCDLVWGDPLEDDTGVGLSDSDMQEWYDVEYVENPTRGCGYVYGHKAVTTFLNNNDLKCIIRAHDVQKQGYLEHMMHRKDSDHPLIITLFSAPNYCDMYGNKAAVMSFEEMRYTYESFEAAPHPYCLPNVMNGLSYSLPFVTEKLTEFMLGILKLCSEVEDKQAEDEEDKQKAMEVVRRKVLAVSKVQAAMKVWATTNNDALALKGLASPKRQAKPATRPEDGSLDSGYEFAKDLDQVNEIRPDLTEIQRAKDFWRERSRTEPPKIRSNKVISRVPGAKPTGAATGGATSASSGRPSNESPQRMHSKSEFVPSK